MTTASKPRKPAARAAQMCVVRIGYQQFALPLTKGLALVDLMASAEPVDYDCHGHYRVDSEPLELRLEAIKPSQVLPALPADAPTLH